MLKDSQSHGHGTTSPQHNRSYYWYALQQHVYNLNIKPENILIKGQSYGQNFRYRIDEVDVYLCPSCGDTEIPCGATQANKSLISPEQQAAYDDATQSQTSRNVTSTD